MSMVIFECSLQKGRFLMNEGVSQLVEECFEMIVGAKNRYCTSECCANNECGMRVLKNKNCALMSFFVGYIRKVDQGYDSITRGDIVIAMYPFVRLGDGIEFDDLHRYLQSGGWKKVRKAHHFSKHGGSVKMRVEKRNDGEDLAYCLVAVDVLREKINNRA